ncbi:MAG: hypothetical protein JO166_07080 [Deltaproteobacteria bacterium]|nr:hypothetical protein [Deltaproteobacteria bacterium]
MNATNDSAPTSHADTGLYVKSRNGLRLRDERVRRLVRRMRAVMPWLEDSDIAVCRAWAELEILSQRVYAELRERGVINSEGDARRLLDDYRKLRSTQIVLSRELAMTPAARIAIKAGKSESVVDLVGDLLLHAADAPAEKVDEAAKPDALET